MFPIILERDTHINDWSNQVAGWCTAMSTISGDTLVVRSDGLVHTDFGTMYVNGVSGPTAGLGECVGVHLTGPVESDEYTPYAISVVAMSEDHLVRPFLFVGVSPASVISDATGNTITKVRILGVSKPIDSWGSSLEKEMTIVSAKMPAGLEGRAICFGVCMAAGTVNAADDNCWAKVSVRRLIGVEPRILDTRKL